MSSHSTPIIRGREPNVEDLLATVKADGKYQILLIALLSFISISTAFIIYSIAFVFYKPDFHCFTDPFRQAFTVCTEAEACANQFGFDVVSPRSSLITQFELYCDKGKVYSYAVAFIFGYTAIVAFLAMLTIDYIGRKMGVMAAVAIAAVFSALALLVKNVWFIVFCMANLMVAYDLFFGACAIWANESVGGRLRSSVMSIVYTVFGLGIIAFYLINYFITDYRTIFWMILFLSVVALPAVYFFYESPVFLVKNNRFHELNQSLAGIARINGAPYLAVNVEPINADIEILVPAQTEDQISTLRAFALPIVALSLVYGNLSMIYSLASLIPQFIGSSNIYLNGVLLSLVEIASYVIMTAIASATPRRATSLLVATVFVIGAVVLFAIAKLAGRKGGMAYFETVICVFIKFVMCINYGIIGNWVVESVPSRLRGKTFAGITLFNRLYSSLTGPMVRWSQQLDINPFSFIFFTSLIALACAFTLKETLGKPLIQ